MIKQILVILVVCCAFGLVITGRKIGWGPFGFLFSYDGEIEKLLKRNPAEENQKRVLFYGASNFRLWKTMEKDIKEYRIINNAFGGSTDKDLVFYADKLLYPYHPTIVVLQTGSNDYVKTKGSDQQILEECFNYKLKMYDQFHQKLKDTKFVVVAGIIMQGRDKYNDIVLQMNQRLKKYCEGKDWLYFVDSQELTYQNGTVREECFVSDGIHLTEKTRIIWYWKYIKPELERIIEKYDIREVVK